MRIIRNIVIGFCVVFILLWVDIHIYEWNAAKGEYVVKEVSVEVIDSVRNGLGMPQMMSKTEGFEIYELSYFDCDIFVRDQYGLYTTQDVGLENKLRDKQLVYPVVSLFLARKGYKRDIVGYRYYDTRTNTYHDAKTKEASLWWAKPEPDFIECFLSLDCTKHLL